MYWVIDVDLIRELGYCQFYAHSPSDWLDYVICNEIKSLKPIIKSIINIRQIPVEDVPKNTVIVELKHSIVMRNIKIDNICQ
jgi:hypothetical protein